MQVVFQSTLPVRGATGAKQLFKAALKYFNPRSPCGERRELLAAKFGIMIYFNPRSPCGERLSLFCRLIPPVNISIHAPRAGSDRSIWSLGMARENFNPRSPCGERLYTYPGIRRHLPHFNPRSPCGERPSWERSLDNRIDISIHAPRAGSDSGFYNMDCMEGIFQSTLPVRGATRIKKNAQYNSNISIHAPRAGSDDIGYWLYTEDGISIHAPRAGSDRARQAQRQASGVFQSTLPVRGATTRTPSTSPQRLNFNPRSPCGERLRDTFGCLFYWRHFNPRSPCGERREVPLKGPQSPHNFNPRSPCGERRKRR